MEFALLIPILAITFAVGVPSVALAAHFVLRPLVRDVTNAIRAGKEDSQTGHRLAGLEDRIGELERRVTHLLEAEQFRRELEADPHERRR